MSISNLERQQRITIKDQNTGRIHHITYRERTVEPIGDPERRKSNYEWNEKNKSHNISLDTKPGDHCFWLGSDFYMTKIEGTIISSVPLFWDYSLPIGQRAIFI